MEANQAKAFYPGSYVEARERFLDAARAMGGELSKHPIDHDPDLTIDVASFLHSDTQRVLVVSSGVHGPEGPFGTAVQLAWLDQARRLGIPRTVGVVLIHAINPFGYANHRRWNECGVDLNRNFLLDDQFSGAPEGYVSLEPLLNPPSVPSRWEPFKAKAVWKILQHGLPAVKQAIAAGQYEYPRGLFFGGKELSCSGRILRKHYNSWIGRGDEIVHLDLHTGLGRFADYRMLLDRNGNDEDESWFSEVFGAEMVEANAKGGTAYETKGSLGDGVRQAIAPRKLRFATAEFGTYGPIRVLAALRAENRAHHYSNEPASFEWTKAELRECFCPQSPKWRTTVLQTGLELVRKAMGVLEH